MLVALLGQRDRALLLVHVDIARGEARISASTAT